MQRELAMAATVMEKVRLKHTEFSKDVREIQKRKELYHPSEREIRRMFTLDVAVLVALYAAAIFFGLQAKAQGFSLVASLPAIVTLVVFAMFLIRFAFKAHNFDHARAANSLLYFQGVDFFVGASSFIWKSQHFATHHKYPNTFYNGENLDSSNRKVFFSERSYDQRPNAKQAGKLSTAISLVLATLFYKQLMFLVFAIAFFKGSYMPHSPQREKKWNDYVFYLFSKACLILMYYVVPYWLFGMYGILGYFIASSIWSAVFYLTFESNHHGMLSKAVYINTDEDLELDFAKLQLYVTLNVGTNNKFYSWLVYDFNYHIEHHLFPAVDVRNYPELSREMKQLVRAKYPELNYYELGCGEALLSVIKQYLFKPKERSVVINSENRLSNILT
jgi:linoleoyl-CoA desaturase